MSPAKTPTERARALRERRAAQGLSEVRGIWAPAALHEAIKAAAARLLKKRAKEGNEPPASG